jgi:hypothetical protein
MVALGLSITADPNSLPIPPILPKLRVLSFDHKNIGASALCNLVSNHAAAGQPLSSLRLPTAILHDEAQASSLNWLRGHVEVVEYQVEAFESDDYDD